MAQSDRPELGLYLRETLGIEHTYFNPPASVHLEYPCIVYSRDNVGATYADNNVYGLNYRYQLTLIDRDPDSPYIEKLASLPLCRWERQFISDNLSHDIFRIYYK